MHKLRTMWCIQFYMAIYRIHILAQHKDQQMRSVNDPFVLVAAASRLALTEPREIYMVKFHWLYTLKENFNWQRSTPETSVLWLCSHKHYWGWEKPGPQLGLCVYFLLPLSRKGIAFSKCWGSELIWDIRPSLTGIALWGLTIAKWTQSPVSCWAQLHA